GWENNAHSSRAFLFDDDCHGHDWNGLGLSGSVQTASEGDCLELSVPLPPDRPLDTSPRVLVMALDSEGYYDMTDFLMSEMGASIEATAHGNGPDLLLPGSQDVIISRIELRSYGDAGEVTAMNFTLASTASLDDLANFMLYEDVDNDGAVGQMDVLIGSGIPNGLNEVSIGLEEPLTVPLNRTINLLLSADIQQTASGVLDLQITDISTSGSLDNVRNVDVQRHYIGVPSDIEIDGAFADWANVGQHVDPANDVLSPVYNYTLMNKNIDIADVRLGLDQELFVYLSVSGVMLGGADIPTLRFRPGMPTTTAERDSDRDSVPDFIDGPFGNGTMRFDFDNDGVNDTFENGDFDSDGSVEHPRGGGDLWMNTTIPDNFPVNYSGNNVSVYVGPINITHVEKRGEDHIYVVVDSDDDPTTGARSRGAVGADHAIVLSGKHNELVSSRLLVFDPSAGNVPWTFVANISSAIDWYRMELSIDPAAMGIAPDENFTVFVSMEDWKGDYDIADLPFDSEDLALQQSLFGATRAAPGDDGILKPKRLLVSKGARPSPAERGEFVTFTITITNNLNYAVLGSVTDILPSGVTGTDLNAWFILNPGDTTVFTIMVQVDYDVPDNTWITNTAEVDFTDDQGNPQHIEADAKFKVQGGPFIIPEFSRLGIVLVGMVCVSVFSSRRLRRSR
ncbi:MAG: DUF11 domain-containing protein, partial [Thermoplasmata archaeon]|nr:DUF11 domain-containing protein [Thermoplasmata archaeon]